MKCSKCGADLPEGKLFCEVCGEEINIVPSYDPDSDISIDLTNVFETTREIDAEEIKQKKSIQTSNSIRKSNSNSGNKKKPVKKIEYDDSFDDFDDSPWDDDSDEDNGMDFIYGIIDFWRKNIVTKIILIMAVVLIFAVILTGVFYIKKLTEKKSSDYYYELGQECFNNNNYDDAIDYYEQGLDIEPENLKIKYAIADAYLSSGQDTNAVFILKEIATEHPEVANGAYEKIFQIYYDNNDWAAINDILINCDNEDIVNKFQEYLCKAPKYSVESGEYDDTILLELVAAPNGHIYYTLDGSDPDENSIIYTDPIYLESGEYDVKSIYISDLGVKSNIAEENYNIKVLIPLAPMVSIEGGSYNVPILISVNSDVNCKTYYVCYRANVKEADRLDPDPIDNKDNTFEYTGTPLIMPMGASEFRFVSYNELGIPSTVITRKYNITIPDATVSKEEGANIATAYRYSLGGLADLDGTVSTTGGKFEYIIEDAINIRNTIYYVINEYYVDKSNGDKRTLTGLRYAVNTKNPEDYGTLEVNTNGDFYVIKEQGTPIN